tara:strand:+ start:910 stop:1284 length:375 start_codon:yes stop_codon:yes gene_type:complete
MALILGSESDAPAHVLNKIELHDAITMLSRAGWILTNREPFSETGKMFSLASANFTRAGLILHVEEDFNGRLELFEVEANKDEEGLRHEGVPKNLRLVEVKDVLRLFGTGADEAHKDLEVGEVN